MQYKGDVMKIDGLPVRDAKHTILLHITERDVRNGRKKKPSRCAAALACMRQLHSTEARVHIGRTYVKIGRKWLRFLTSRALRSEIVAFDRGGTFEPGDYTLQKMQPSRKYDVSRDDRTSRRNGRRKKRIRHILTEVRPMGIVA